jgi:predicted dehydrogenase
VSAHPGLQLTAVVDPLESRRREAVSQYRTRAYATLAEALDQELLDLVVIASPTQFHANQALLSFGYGCDVFCDKPLAPTLAEADLMIAAMQDRGRKLMAYQPHRAGQEVVALLDVLQKGLIGPVYMIKRARTAYIRRNDWQAFRSNGGGMLSNYGAHFVDQLLYMSGSRATRVSCSLRTIASLGDADDVVKVTIETESGIILDLDINMAAAHPHPPWCVLGQRGSIVWREDARAWHARYYDPDEAAPPKLDASLAAPDRLYPSDPIPWQDESIPVALYEAVDYYAKCYAYYCLDEPPFVPIAETRELMRVLDACRRSADSS